MLPLARHDVKKMNSLYRRPGCEVWSTDQADVVVMEWESESACRVALSVQTVLRRHAVQTNYLDSFGLASLLVTRIEPLGFAVMVQVAQGETAVTFVGPDGAAEVQALPDFKQIRLSALEDTAAHAARSLRAHLTPVGVHDLRLHLRIGTGPDNETLFEVINPVECDFGITDPEVLLAQLGGDPK